MQSGGRKRGVSSCISCYIRKQKCNREYPCNHCTRRRRPEECAYYPSQATQAANNGKTPPQTDDRPNSNDESQSGISGYQQRKHSAGNEVVVVSLAGLNRRGSSTSHQEASLAELFGYFEDSESNTMALIRTLELNDENQDGKNQVIPQDIADAVQQDVERMPDRQILDFLMQYFVAEINWMDQLVHPPSFLAQYQKWWAKAPLSSVADVEFAVLLLRICSYASQFLPSPSYTCDTIRGMSLADIRNTCDDIGDNLAGICASLDARGSLLRVQHLSFAGLRSQCEGRTNVFWESLSCAIRVAQRVGIHRDATASMHSGMHELEKEMRRRTFCNLYIWDSLLSRQLDRIPFLPSSLDVENLPQMHLVPDGGDSDAPDGFTGRLLQARMAEFWRSHCPGKCAEYDLTLAEEKYEKFCSEFVTILPPAFALQPNKEWDERVPMLPRQRQQLHIIIFDFLCWNFRPVLLLERSYILSLPPYKQVLLRAQRKALAVAALNVLEAVGTLHAMLGASHTRFAGIIFHTFEAAVLLASLCTDLDFPGDSEDGLPSPIIPDADPLGIGVVTVTREGCIQAAQDALNCLRMLADGSKMAEAGARTLSCLLDRVTSKPEANAVNWASFEPLEPNPLGEFLSATTSEDTFPNWELLAMDFDYSLVNVEGWLVLIREKGYLNSLEVPAEVKI